MPRLRIEEDNVSLLAIVGVDLVESSIYDVVSVELAGA
jgi:hypothetical protein